MLILGLLTEIYIFIASFAALMTYDEQRQTGGRGIMLTTLGLLACLFWPLTFLTVAVAAQRSSTLQRGNRTFFSEPQKRRIGVLRRVFDP